MPIETYLNLVDEKQKNLVMPIIEYIQNEYKQVIFDEKYSEKTYIPTYRLDGKYVALACRKQYISVYFGCDRAVEVVKQNLNSQNVKLRKGCVNISYSIKDFPYDAIYRGIDACFKK